VREKRVDLDRGQRVLRQPADLLDVRPFAGQRRCQRVQVGGAQRRANRGDDVAAPLRRAGPGFARRDRLEVELHAQLLGREQELLEHVPGLGDAHQQTERQLALDDDLLDVVQGRPLLGQDAGQGGGDPGAVGTSDGYEDAIISTVGHGAGESTSRPAACAAYRSGSASNACRQSAE
jgi:hypothetical protein